MQIVGKTDVGAVRESNQDTFYYDTLSESVYFAIVCDGMGGANAGNVASECAVRSISDYIKRSYKDGMSSMQIENILRSAIVTANSTVYEMSRKDENLFGMGTTVVLLFVSGNTGYVLHIGDSRMYIYTADNFNQITVDHSIVQNMIDSGKITPDEAKEHPSKNIITRALGVNEEVKADMDFVTLNKDDIVLLCSDGLTNFVTDEEIVEIIKCFDETVAARLIDKANRSGGGDNVTAVAVKI
ncbi:MAG: Stp1/IreP family PP2C-type Ser/Thr phosphatase [Ruminococcaceae bacterium]|nr:Stp1/IreP family PP2C-type Ser/Thr phosphatase [Oscillospiraceae bacterium]